VVLEQFVEFGKLFFLFVLEQFRKCLVQFFELLVKFFERIVLVALQWVFQQFVKLVLVLKQLVLFIQQFILFGFVVEFVEQSFVLEFIGVVLFEFAFVCIQLLLVEFPVLVVEFPILIVEFVVIGLQLVKFLVLFVQFEVLKFEFVQLSFFLFEFFLVEFKFQFLLIQLEFVRIGRDAQTCGHDPQDGSHLLMIKYGIDYYEGLLRIQSKTAQDIAEIRWGWIEHLRPKYVLDYGSGVGFFRAFRPPGIEVDTYDVGPVAQTGITRDCYDVICFFDVLEHIADWATILPVMHKAKYIAGTVPILNDGKDLFKWKHYKPGEHFHYWHERGFEVEMNRIGFEKMAHGWPECPPRVDILSFQYRRV